MSKSYEDRIESGDILIPQWDKDLLNPNKMPILDDNSMIIGFRDRLPGEPCSDNFGFRKTYKRIFTAKT